jgi:AcrR family transcriptional regulator
MTAPRRRGRPRGPSTVAADILQAARELFADLGYDRTTIRAIAARAGVDPASVHHHHGSKRDLLAAALELPFDPTSLATAFDPDTGIDGRELLRRALAIWDAAETRLQLRALLRIAVADDEAAGVVRDLFTRQLVAVLSEWVPGPDAELRAALVASQMAGLAMLRLVVPVAAIADADAETLLDAVAPTLARYLDPAVPIAVPGRRSRRGSG